MKKIKLEGKKAKWTVAISLALGLMTSNVQAESLAFCLSAPSFFFLGQTQKLLSLQVRSPAPPANRDLEATP